MIRFIDIEEYVIHIGEMSRFEMINFFIQPDINANERNHEKHNYINKIITVLDNNNDYYGMVIYPNIIKYSDENDYILRDVMPITKQFFENANKWFEENQEELLLLLSDVNGNRVGYCYNDCNKVNDYSYKVAQLTIEQIQSLPYIPISLFDLYNNCNQICIIDCNELAYKSYLLFVKLGYSVCVIGEKWEWLGITMMEGYMNVPENQKIYIYTEGNSETKWQWTINNDPPFVESFRFLDDWRHQIRKYIYSEITSFLSKKNVSRCCIEFPEYNEITYWTDAEKKGKLQKLDMNNIRYNYLSQNQKNALASLVDDNTLEHAIRDRLPFSWEPNEYTNTEYNEITTCCPKENIHRNRIYLVGPCIVRGIIQLHEDTLCYQLNKIVNTIDYDVIQCSFTNMNWNDWLIYDHIKRLPIKEHDIFIFADFHYMFELCENIKKISIIDEYNNTERDSWIIDKCSMHVNKNATPVIASTIMKRFISTEAQRLNMEITNNNYIQSGEVLSDKLKQNIYSYTDCIRINELNSEEKTIGGIVMNCNPFTYGHQFLLEYAASHVDIVYVFVVEEDRSEFAFTERIEMVKRGCSHLANVHVVPSSEWILSYKTMPAYFGKSEYHKEKVNARMDLEIFARYIAPSLGISKRFVGEEPSDNVTRQYNEQMKTILGEFGIEVEEIQRKNIDGKIISASYVRKCLSENNFNEIKKYVPKTTYDAIVSRRKI